MKRMIPVLAGVVFSMSSMAWGSGERHSHGDKHESKYGGVVTEVKEIQYELVAKADSLAIYVEDHGKKVSTKDGSAKVTLLNGTEKTEVMLAPAGDNKLEARGTYKVGKGTKAIAVVTMPGKPAQSVRFNLGK